jgi:hypothetical protein
VAGRGIALYPGTQLPEITEQLLGTSIRQDVFAIFETAGETLGLVEIMDQE